MPLISIRETLDALTAQLERLLAGSAIRFDEGCRRNLPEQPGIYRIFDIERADQTLRAGRADVTLRQRVYQNHLMGDQAGNLRAQLVRAGECTDLNLAKDLMRHRLAVQVLPVADQRERAALEHFMLAILRPRFSDRSQA